MANEFYTDEELSAIRQFFGSYVFDLIVARFPKSHIQRKEIIVNCDSYGTYAEVTFKIYKATPENSLVDKILKVVKEHMEELNE